MEYIDPTKMVQSFITHINSKRNLAFLFGAGISISYIPTIDKITNNIGIQINEASEKSKQAWTSLKEEAIAANKHFNIEYVFSSLSNKILAVGKEKLLGMNRKELVEYIKSLESLFKQEVTKNIKPDENGSYERIIIDSPHIKFAEWLSQRNDIKGIEIFTPNYDYLLELAFEYQKIKYFDGFSGCFIPYFDAAAIENFEYRKSDVKLWKVHGSLGWCGHQNNIIKSLTSINDIMILPSSLKYDETKKLPYTVLLDRLGSLLKSNETTLIICGYSFNDNHINETIINSLQTNKSSQVFAFIYDKEPTDGNSSNINEANGCSNSFSVIPGSHYEQICKQSNQIMIFGFRSVIYKGETYITKLSNYPQKPDNDIAYFSYDTEKNQGSDAHECNGFGELRICDFKEMASYLKRTVGEVNGQQI